MDAGLCVAILYVLMRKYVGIYSVGFVSYVLYECACVCRTQEDCTGRGELWRGEGEYSITDDSGV